MQRTLGDHKSSVPLPAKAGEHGHLFCFLRPSCTNSPCSTLLSKLFSPPHTQDRLDEQGAHQLACPAHPQGCLQPGGALHLSLKLWGSQRHFLDDCPRACTPRKQLQSGDMLQVSLQAVTRLDRNEGWGPVPRSYPHEGWNSQPPPAAGHREEQCPHARVSRPHLHPAWCSESKVM